MAGLILEIFNLSRILLMSLELTATNVKSIMIKNIIKNSENIAIILILINPLLSSKSSALLNAFINESIALELISIEVISIGEIKVAERLEE